MRNRKSLLAAFIFILFLQIAFISVASAVTRIMPLGDSITYDEYTADPRPAGLKTAYRSHLWYSLIDANYDVDFVGSEQGGQDVEPPFDPDSEGHPGFKADQIRDAVADYLATTPADVVLLHIGTNDISNSQPVAEIVMEVSEILDEIFTYDPNITVILAEIINRVAGSPQTTQFNNLLVSMAANHTFSANIVTVDMENGAGIDYRLSSDGGDMIDDLHPDPDGEGYGKMADLWFFVLQDILPDPDPPNNPPSSRDDDDDDAGCFISIARQSAFSF